MPAVQEGISVKPRWRYRDDAPPVRPPSRKRKLGAVLVYLVGTAGVGAAIFWPSEDQALAFSAFKIPPSPFTALITAVAAPEPGLPQPNSNRLAVSINRSTSPAVNLLHRQNSGQVSTASQSTTVPVVEPNPARAQTHVPPPIAEPHPVQQTATWATTSEPTESQTTPNRTEPDQRATRHKPRSHDANPDGHLEHRTKGHSGNRETAKPPPNSAPHQDPTPPSDSAPGTTSDSASA